MSNIHKELKQLLHFYGLSKEQQNQAIQEIGEIFLKAYSNELDKVPGLNTTTRQLAIGCARRVSGV